jgi:hypothetical protein
MVETEAAAMSESEWTVTEWLLYYAQYLWWYVWWYVPTLPLDARLRVIGFFVFVPCAVFWALRWGHRRGLARLRGSR